ncbi:MAG: SUMF1/EgtB/PvdO family nonheme iron enzyme [Planctomycetes bacterium]|nr:SUMF1/EgtB/PvdO family nonheme iron enzyme [Planctomycetota bacterium]
MMRIATSAVLFSAILVVLLLGSRTCPAQGPGGGKGFEVIAASASRYAVLVGVNDYEKFSDLTYCKADVTALRDQLVKIGFDRRDIAVLTDGAKMRPSRRNILEQLDATLKVADETDLIVVALSGHGARIGGKSYFCPLDARPDDPKGTMILIEDLYAKLEKCPARLKIVFIDACRNKFLPVDAKPLAEQQKSIDGFAKSLSDGAVPKGVALLASCTSGELSWEDKEFGHGVFMHFVLEGLSGKADQVGGDGKKDQWVSLFELFDYVRSETKRHVLRTRRVSQRPHYHTSLDLPDFRLTKVLDIVLPGYTNSIAMKFKLIPAGEFTMGSPTSEKNRGDDEKQHRVKITKPFYLGVHEVTQGEFEKVMGTSPWKGKERVKEGSDYPASYISWDDAVEFCKKLSAKEGRTYRLPTEAQWEYACRADSKTAYSFGSDASKLGEYAWYDDNADEVGEKYAHLVGQKRANAYGLYDMHGNVHEWCSDCYGEEYYAASDTVDPTGPTKGSIRMFRGGAWNGSVGRCRSASRMGDTPGYRDWDTGFRVARVRSE